MNVSKGCPKTPPKPCGMVTSPQSVVWSHMWLSPQPTAISMNFYSCMPLAMMKWNKSTVVSVQSAMVSRFCIKPYLREVVFENSPSDHETWSLGIHVDFTSMLHSHTPIGLSSIVWSELGPAPPCPPNESASSGMGTSSQSHVWSGPRYRQF